MDQKDPEQYFAILLDICNQIIKDSINDHSITSPYVYSFIESFKNCVRRLKKAGVNLNGCFFPQNFNDFRNSYN